MFDSSRMGANSSLNINIPWDSNTAKGFGVALLCTLIGLLVAPYMSIEPPPVRNLEVKSIPVTLLNIGPGDGTGMSKGNLTEEGARNKGSAPSSELQDAERAGKTKKAEKASPEDFSEAERLIASKEVSSDARNREDRGGSDRENVGSPDGTDGGRGLGETGTGKGKGLGFGDIEWGGGGNRTVLVKKVPAFPPGVDKSARIKIRFTVLPDGTVSRMVPLQKADPRLEKAAMDALRQWRFNPLDDKDLVMVGVIPLTFRLR